MHFRSILGAGAALGVLVCSAPAFATVSITDTQCAPGSGCANVHLVPDVGTPDNLAYGTVDGANVTFTGNENIATGNGGGLPWVHAYDGGMTYLDVALDSPATFTLAGFNLNDLPGNGDWFVKVSAFNGASLLASDVFTESHNTKFEIAATGGDVLTHFQIQLVTDATGATSVPLDGATTLDGVGQIRIGGVGGVPEPSAWALMILGFGGVGATLRKRRAKIVAA